MKVCPNQACRRVWPDDYNGTCVDCGGSMQGSVKQGVASGINQGVNAHLMGLTANAQKERNMESQIKNHQHSSIRPDDHLMDIARKFVIGPEK